VLTRVVRRCTTPRVGLAWGSDGICDGLDALAVGHDGLRFRLTIAAAEQGLSYGVAMVFLVKVLFVVTLCRRARPVNGTPV
jgi:hypothetical protein